MKDFQKNERGRHVLEYLFQRSDKEAPHAFLFSAPTGELYELLCHSHRKRRKKKKSRRAQMVFFWNNSECAVLIWTKFGMDVLLNPRNKPAEFFLSFLLKIQDGRCGRHYGKLQNRS